MDRDGTISTEMGYIDSVEAFELYPYSVQALSALQSLGFKLVVITNQSGVARGLFPESRVVEINNRMQTLLSEAGVTLDGVYYCPHLPEGSVAEYSYKCTCRKPDIGMIKQAAREHTIALEKSVMVGDALSDIACGRNAAIKTILVRTGYGRNVEKSLKGLSPEEQPDAVVDTLEGAMEWIKHEAF